jgi:hypothetical protein
MALALAAAPVTSRAQDIYESVDSQGHVVYSDQSSAPSADQSAPQDEAQSPPRVVHVCWTNCFTLVGENGVYGRADGTDENWTVERFTADAFVLKRHDAPVAWNGYHAEVTYAGQVANDRLINVTVDGQPVGSIQMAWGSALDTLPGSDAERDRLAQNGSSAPTGEPAPDVGSGALPATSGEPLAASEAPPPLPDEEQPPCAVVGSIWAPGYWVWVAPHYYWIAGAWMHPPQPGLMWTPGYWTFINGAYVFRRGVWGSHVGYYGGINYGHGYFGSGYNGGRWVNGTFIYNTAVSRVNTSVILNTYRETPTEIATSKVSYHGGIGGTTTPSPVEKHIVFAEPHVPPSPHSRPYATPKLAHVVQNPVGHTTRNTVRHASVVTPTLTHRQSSSPPRATADSTATRPVSHATRPVALHAHP